ncbi:uncharacterized protein [Rhodnius prolixus]|uniref:uncharacterized protein n=1 Tax=Rhodnius prolixus TaxID=13249 RepID=UPI003D18C7BE
MNWRGSQELSSNEPPHANGVIERWHRTLKTALRCHGTDSWMGRLPTVLLGLRAAVREDTGLSPAEHVYGTTLRLPGEFVGEEFTNQTQTEVVQQLKRSMRALRPAPTVWHARQKPFVHQQLGTGSHVFLRIVAHRSPLAPPYEVPYPVLSRTDKTLCIDRRGKSKTVTIDRIKAAYGLATPGLVITPVAPEPTQVQERQLGAHPIDTTQNHATRSGRISKTPQRYGTQRC